MKRLLDSRVGTKDAAQYTRIVSTFFYRHFRACFSRCHYDKKGSYAGTVRVSSIDRGITSSPTHCLPLERLHSLLLTYLQNIYILCIHNISKYEAWIYASDCIYRHLREPMNLWSCAPTHLQNATVIYEHITYHRIMNNIYKTALLPDQHLTPHTSGSIRLYTNHTSKPNKSNKANRVWNGRLPSSSRLVYMFSKVCLSNV